MPVVQQAVELLTDLGVRVLSPADPRVVDELDGFVFVASDVHRSVRLVQQRHLAAIEASDFLWLVAPDGYVGSSASMEIGFATAVGTPVFAAAAPSDTTLRRYVTVVGDLTQAIARLRDRPDGNEPALLVDPHVGFDVAHRQLDVLHASLTTPDRVPQSAALDAADEMRRLLSRV